MIARRGHHGGPLMIACLLVWSIVANASVSIRPAKACSPLAPGREHMGRTSARQQRSEVTGQAVPDEQTFQALLAPTERTELSRQSNIGKRMKLLLKFAAQRLDRIHQLALREEYGVISRISNEYKALITYAYSLIETISPKPNRRKSAYRDFDLEVRKQIRTLEQIERLIPLSQSGDVSDAIRTATRLRHNALNAFAGDRIFKSPSSKQH